MSKRCEVALLVESSRGYGRGLLQGIAQYTQAHGHWATRHHERALGDSAPGWLKKWRGDGIIARIDSEGLLKQIEKLDVPTVDLRLLYDVENIPRVGVDNIAVTRMAADHLLERKFEYYALCGFAGVDYSEQRRKYFIEYLDGLGYEVDVWMGSQSGGRHTTAQIEARGLVQDTAMEKWLESLPKPVGLMATNDVRAQQVLTACNQCGISVPDEIAVVGVDNDPVICELCHPPLSSIQLQNEKMGYEAAAMLDMIMQGQSHKEHDQRWPPSRIFTRQSTDVVAIPDAATAAAMHFIREHACNGIAVDTVFRHVAVSRSTLERRFAKYLDSTPRAEIVRVQIQRVKQLLTGTDYPLIRIAQLAGFNHVEYMCSLFKNREGQTAGRYRKEQMKLRGLAPPRG